MVQWLSFSRQNRKFHCEKLNCLTWQSSWCDDEMRLYHDIRSYADVQYNKAKNNLQIWRWLVLVLGSLTHHLTQPIHSIHSVSFHSFTWVSFILLKMIPSNHFLTLCFHHLIVFVSLSDLTIFSLFLPHTQQKHKVILFLKFNCL